MTPDRFRNLVEELGAENPLAIRPFLRILEVRFTKEVPTLAVTREERPALLVNLDFLDMHCETDEHVKAVVLHEYLHILLRHTERRGPVTVAEHIATDAVINAIIHRQAGEAYSSMMSKYYAREKGLLCLLRPRGDSGSRADVGSDQLWQAWCGLEDGTLVVDDIREIAQQLEPKAEDVLVLGRLLGNHDEESALPDAIVDVLNDALRTMNGGGVWRSPSSRGFGETEYEALVRGEERAREEWKRKTLGILRRYVVPDSRPTGTELSPSSYMLPVLSTGDRRAFVRSIWSPFLPEARWSTEVPRPVGTTNVYLDVSGSMNAEMPLVIALLSSLRRHIRMPFWAFSNSVAPATIRDGALVTRTTGGTSIECVLKHIAQTKPESAVIFTDGYIETVYPQWMRDIGNTRVHAIVTRDGSTNLLDRARIACTQLERVP